MKWFVSLVNCYYYRWCHECVNAFQRLLFSFSPPFISYWELFACLYYTLYILRHFYQQLVSPSFFFFFSFNLFLCLHSQSFLRRLHHVNWLALLFSSKNAFWRVSFDDSDDDEKHIVRRNTTTLDLCQQHNEAITHIYIYTYI